MDDTQGTPPTDPQPDAARRVGDRRSVRYLLALAAAVVTALTVATINASWLTPGASPTAVEHIHAAEAMARGEAPSIPITPWSSESTRAGLTRYPPGMAAGIAATMRTFGVRSHVAGVWMMAFGAGAVVGISFLMASALGGLAGGGVALLLLATTPAWTTLHLVLGSESVYLAIALAGVWLLIRSPHRHLVHGVLSALSVMVHFAGVAGTATAVVRALHGSGPRRHRAVNALAAGLPTVIVLTAWWVFLRRGTGDLPGPGVSTFVLMTIAAGLAAVAVDRGVGRRGAESPRRRAVAVSGAYAGAWGAALLTQRLLGDASVTIDTRHFAPVLVLATLGAGVAVAHLVRSRGWAIGVPVSIAVVAWSLIGIREARVRVTDTNAGGIHYTDRDLVQDISLAWVFAESDDYIRVYSNEPHLLVFHGDRTASLLPERGEDLDAFEARFRADPSPVVVVTPASERAHDADLWSGRLGLREFRRTDRIVILLPADAPEFAALGPDPRD
ncbi:MAG: hypothetical protein RQ745_01470 [Longimicrobiales bacterium]|nr:hypothetical protein [Longimicrobiales bacterium]